MIVDYDMGNLASVYNALGAIETPGSITREPMELRNADIIILPGVGAFGDGVQNLRQAGWVDSLQEEVLQKQKPFLGICVGMQVLADTGTEHGSHIGLGWVPALSID